MSTEIKWEKYQEHISIGEQLNRELSELIKKYGVLAQTHKQLFSASEVINELLEHIHLLKNELQYFERYIELLIENMNETPAPDPRSPWL